MKYVADKDRKPFAADLNEYSGYHVPAVRHKETKKSVWLEQY